MKINPALLIDGYKCDHRRQYPEGTSFVFSNFTPRKSRVDGINEVVFFGLQYFVKEYLIDQWNEGFFSRPKEEVISEYRDFLDRYLGPGAVPIEHIGQLHDLGFLPIKIRAVPEGTTVPIGVPVLTIINTRREFFWLTNYLETLISNILWKPITSATTAHQYRKEFDRHADKTGYDAGFIQFQGHDFSFRGMSGIEDAVMSSAAHLLSFVGTDTIPAISFINQYYTPSNSSTLIGCSVPASEHSVMSMGSKDGEIETFKRFITELYPSGIVSVVSDTWDFWKVMTEYLPTLKVDILARDGRLVIRPDSGDPVDIICGTAYKYFDVGTGMELNDSDWADIILDDVAENTPHGEYGGDEHTYHYKYNENYYEVTIHNVEWNRHDKQYYYIDMFSKPKMTITKIDLSPAEIGAYELLWNTFGGTINEKGYKELNPKVGLIYGDSITLDRQKIILQRLEEKGFSASNLVLGIGSYTYEYVTRDTFGFAMKATWGMVNGESREIFKDPITDSGMKKSAKGLLKVNRDPDGKLTLVDQISLEEFECYDDAMQLVFLNGDMMVEVSIEQVREVLHGNS